MKALRYIAVLAVGIAFAGKSFAGLGDQSYPLDVDLDDRVDPVEPGSEIVYELEVENFTLNIAHEVVVTSILPPGTTYVGARRQPDFSEVAAEVGSGQVRWNLGDVLPCDQIGTARCRDLWVVLRIDDSVAPGTRLAHRVEIEASDPITFPPNSATTVTTAAALALRHGNVDSGRPGRDSVRLFADLARPGRHAPDHPPTPSIVSPSDTHVTLLPAVGPPLLDLEIAGDAYRCTSRHCRYSGLIDGTNGGRIKLDLHLRPETAQRNNASATIKLTRMTIPPDLDVNLELRIATPTHAFVGEAMFERMRSGRLLYSHNQAQP